MDAEEINSDLGEELSEYVANPVEEEEVVTESVESRQPAKRGRRAIPTKWTPVMSLDQDDPVKMILKELAADTLLA